MNGFSPMLLKLLLQSAVLPAILGLLLLWVQGRWQVYRHAQAAGAMTSGSAIAISLAWLAAAGWISGFTIPPVQTQDWLPWLTLSAGAVLSIAERMHLGEVGRRGLQVALVLVAAGLLLAPVLRQMDTMDAGWLLGASVLAWWGLWWWLDAPRAGAAPGVVLLVVAGGGALALALTGSVLLGQLSGALTAALGGWLLWAARANRPLGAAGLAVAIVTLGGLLLIGQTYAGLPMPVLGLLLAAAGLGGGWIRLRRGRDRPWRVLLASVLVPALPVLAAIWLVLRFYMPPSGEF